MQLQGRLEALESLRPDSIEERVYASLAPSSSDRSDRSISARQRPTSTPPRATTPMQGEALPMQGEAPQEGEAPRPRRRKKRSKKRPETPQAQRERAHLRSQSQASFKPAVSKAASAQHSRPASSET